MHMPSCEKYIFHKCFFGHFIKPSVKPVIKPKIKRLIAAATEKMSSHRVVTKPEKTQGVVLFIPFLSKHFETKDLTELTFTCFVWKIYLTGYRVVVFIF